MTAEYVDGIWTQTELGATRATTAAQGHLRADERVIVVVGCPRVRAPRVGYAAVTNQRRLLLIDRDTLMYQAQPADIQLHIEGATVQLTGGPHHGLKLHADGTAAAALRTAWQTGKLPPLDVQADPVSDGSASSLITALVLLTLGVWAAWAGADAVDRQVLDELGRPLGHTPILERPLLGMLWDYGRMLVGAVLALMGLVGITTWWKARRP